MAAINEKTTLQQDPLFAASGAPGAVPAPAAAPSGGSDYYNAFTSVFDPVSAPLADTMNRFHTWKENMGLIQPGTVENLTRPVSSEFATGNVSDFSADRKNDAIVMLGSGLCSGTLCWTTSVLRVYRDMFVCRSEDFSDAS